MSQCILKPSNMWKSVPIVCVYTSALNYEYTPAQYVIVFTILTQWKSRQQQAQVKSTRLSACKARKSTGVPGLQTHDMLKNFVKLCDERRAYWWSIIHTDDRGRVSHLPGRHLEG